VSGGSVAIKVNDDVGNYFQTLKGLRQGDPLSQMLFNIVTDMLAIMIERAKNDGLIEGVIPHLVDEGLSILQYANDTILFMEHDLEKAQNLKLIHSAFEQLLGLKINFHKSELFCFGEAQDEVNAYAELFGYGQGHFLCGIWGFRFIIVDLQLLNENSSRKDYKNVLVVGKVNCCL
jgi:hypothetical protein